MHINENKKFDKRNIGKNIKNGIITQKDYEIYLSKLPDAGDKLFSPEETTIDSQEFGLEKRRKAPLKRKR